MVHLPIVDEGKGLHTWTLAANILNMQSWTDNKGWSSTLGSRRSDNTSVLRISVIKCYTQNTYNSNSKEPQIDFWKETKFANCSSIMWYTKYTSSCKLSHNCVVRNCTMSSSVYVLCKVPCQSVTWIHRKTIDLI
jgi:hypothetical protein